MFRTLYGKDCRERTHCGRGKGEKRTCGGVETKSEAASCERLRSIGKLV